MRGSRLPLIWEQTVKLGDWDFRFSFLTFLSVGKRRARGSDCEGLCWNLAARWLGEQPHAGCYSAGQFSSSFGSFTQPCTQWLHKADYKLQRIPEGAKSDAGANEPREPLIPVTEWDKLGKAWTTQIQAHQAAESLPWEPGVIIRPIQRGPGTLGARKASSRGRAGGRGDPDGPAAGLGRWPPSTCAFAPMAPVKSVLGQAPVNTSRDRGRSPVCGLRATFVQPASRPHRPVPVPAWRCGARPLPQATDRQLRGSLCALSPPARLSHLSSWQPGPA